MRVEMVTRSWKNTRYKYLVSPMGLYHSLKDSPCCSEWIDVHITYVALWEYAVGVDPFLLYGRHSKILEKADFNKHALSLALQTFAYKQSLFSMNNYCLLIKSVKLAISILLPSAMDKRNSVSLALLMHT